MLRFCDTCKRITPEREMHTDDICVTCYIVGADERRIITEVSKTKKSEASTEPTGEGESGPYLPGLAPAQEIGISGKEFMK